MTDTSPANPFDPANTFVDLAPDGTSVPLPVTSDFWDRLAQGSLRIAGRMVSFSRMTADWSHWERHPAGDELLIVMSGALDLILDEPDGDRRVRLQDRAGFIVPRGVWHRAEVHAPADILFITAGEGTEHRPLEPTSTEGS